MRNAREDEFRAYVVDARARLVRTATLLTAGDRHLAEDLVQTTLTRLYLAWPRIRAADGPDGYARRTLVNALIDERRRPFRRRETTHAEVPDRALHTSDDDPESALQAALADLPPGMRAAVVFRHVYDLSVSDTADALGCSEGNVKSQTARGLERLRTALTSAPTPLTTPRSTR
ncbi:SigE family RNA polymerase sigma factor [Acidothermaceae bacterium B102]|nr:SigE family RNA polymerase sigma factor [Acidothermaceae bacterium B102]